MTTEVAAIVVATATALLAVGNLVWGISSWHRSGGTLRTHALAYGEVLVIRVFNAGRTTNTIEELVIGGRRGGHGGDDVTDELSLPIMLQPGQSKTWSLRPSAEPLASRWKLARSGWVSLHMLTGAGRQIRADVLPMPAPDAPPAGWHFVPRRVKAYRYEPLFVGLPILIAAASGAGMSAIGLVAGVVLIYIGNRFLIRAGRPTFARRRLETIALALTIPGALALAFRAEDRLPGAELPMGDTAALILYGVTALVLAMPGWAEQVIDVARHRNKRAGRRGFPTSTAR